MRAVVTRVQSASVTVDDAVVGAIGAGFLVLLGVGPNDTEQTARKLAEKILSLRVFEDENGKMNRGLSDVGGSVLVISQFTLFGDTTHGRRPSFFGAAAPDKANALYERFLSDCAALGFPPQHGIFGAKMAVASVNDGPVTLWIDTEEWEKA